MNISLMFEQAGKSLLSNLILRARVSSPATTMTPTVAFQQHSFLPVCLLRLLLLLRPPRALGIDAAPLPVHRTIASGRRPRTAQHTASAAASTAAPAVLEVVLTPMPPQLLLPTQPPLVHLQMRLYLHLHRYRCARWTRGCNTTALA